MDRLKGITRLPLLVFSLSFLLGIVFASLLTLNTWIWLLFPTLSVLIGWGLPRLFRWATVHADGTVRGLLTRLPGWITQPLSKSLIEPNLYLRLVLTVLVGVFLGAARYQAAQPVFTLSDAAWYNDKSDPLALTGMIVRPPDVRETHVQVVLDTEEITQNGVPIPVGGRVLAYLSTAGNWTYGDRVRVWGLLQTPPVHEDFSYQDYLARQGIYGYMPYTSAEIVDRGNGNRLLSALYRFQADRPGVDLQLSARP